METTERFKADFNKDAFLRFASNPLDTQATFDIYTGLKANEENFDHRSKRVDEICRTNKAFMKLFDDRYLPPFPTLDELEELPEGTLGRAFAKHILANQIKINFAGLDTSMFLKRKNPVLEFFALRGVRTHDLYHVVLGLGTTEEDEYCLLAVQLAQLSSSFHLLLLSSGLVHMAVQKHEKLPEFLDRLFQHYELGKRIGFLAGFPYEEHWRTSLGKVRSQLGIAID